MSSPIRVLFDATSLGYGAEAGVGRAGIFRAAQGLIGEALRRPDLDVDIAALDSFFGEVQAARYLRDAGAAPGPRFRRAWHHPTASHLDSLALVDRVADVGETSVEGRRLMATLALMNRLARPAGTLGPYDVYQSLRPALVPDHRVSARARVLFVHDLIPLLFPDLSGDGFDTALRAILASVVPARDWIVCNSECTRRDVCAHLPIDPDRVFVTPLAADPAVFHPVADADAVRIVRHHHGIGDHPYVLSLSTIEPRKNLAHLVRCFSRIVQAADDGDRLRLVLVGATGWKAAEVFDAIEHDAIIRDRVVLTGHVPDEDLAALYVGADAFVYPSRYEGFGLPVLEAMYCGVPVVTTTGGALPEVVGQAGLVVDPDDADGLVEAVLAARGNTRLIVEGYSRAAEFTWARTIDLTIAAYRVMLAGY